MIPLIEKYRVDNLNDIKGQSIAVEEVRNFLRMFPAKKALILNGPVGTGKTSMALALAKENDLELFELNASDLRNRSSLEAVLKPSLEQQSLFGKGKLILMDEADGITGSDRGGLPELIALISKTKVPIIITSNDIWKKKFSLLRKSCKIVSLKELSDIDVKQIITEVLKKEDKKIKPETIDLIVKGARGDVRAALNDLESVILLGEENIDDISLREKKQDIFNDLKKLFQNQVDEQTLRIFDNSDLSIDEILLWIEENIPLEYQGKALTKAYECLSRADIFKGRIYRKQYWRFLVYQSFFLSGGVASATRLKNNRFISYKKPTRILKIWMANMRNAKIKSIIEKYAKLCHMSKKKAMKDKNLMPLILSSLNEETKNKMDLEDKEIDYLKEKEIDLVVSSGLNRYK
jgi:replication factor C large subunit|tara:strand:- start:844 stop:2061 length:1218 start_codon:yes stop_codon:yes gene_type:complete